MLLPIQIQDETHLFKVVETVIDWYAAEGRPGERFGATIDRVGMERLVQFLSDIKQPPE